VRVHQAVEEQVAVQVRVEAQDRPAVQAHQAVRDRADLVVLMGHKDLVV
jgi:hypothetical protein